MTIDLDNLGRTLRDLYGPEQQAVPGQHRLRTPQCPSLVRFGAALQNGWTPQERSHVYGCTYCRQLLGREKPEELRALIIEALAALRILFGCIQLRRRGTLAASTGGAVEVTRLSPDQRLESTFYEDEDRLVLEVRTREPALEHQLVRYAIQGRDGSEVRAGFLVLARAEHGWIAAHATFAADPLHEQAQGLCQALEVRPVAAESLTTGDRPALLASLAEPNETERTAWRSWLDRTERENEALPAEIAPLLSELRERLK
jgi:hypothetical protein